MPRAFLKKKNRGGKHVYTCGKCHKPVQAGEQYWTWKFNHGGRFYQHTTCGAPQRSQMTNSKMGQVWDAVESFDVSACESPEDILTELSTVAEAATTVAEEYTSAADGIESAWPAGNPTSEACRATAGELESWAQELGSWAPDYDEWNPETHDTKEEWLDEIRESASRLMEDCPEYQA